MGIAVGYHYAGLITIFFGRFYLHLLCKGFWRHWRRQFWGSEMGREYGMIPLYGLGPIGMFCWTPKDHWNKWAGAKPKGEA